MFKFGGSAGRVRRSKCTVGPHAGRGSGIGLRGPQRQFEGRSMGPSLRSSREVRCAVPCRHFGSCPRGEQAAPQVERPGLSAHWQWCNARSCGEVAQPESPLVGGPPMVHSGRIFFFFWKACYNHQPPKAVSRTRGIGPPGRLESNRRKTALRSRFVRTPWTCKAGSAAGL